MVNELKGELTASKVDAIYNELVLNPLFADYLRKRNLYEVDATGIVPPNFFWMME